MLAYFGSGSLSFTSFDHGASGNARTALSAAPRDALTALGFESSEDEPRPEPEQAGFDQRQPKYGTNMH